MADRLEQAPGSNVSNEAIAQFAIEAGKAQREIDEATGRKRAVLKRAKAAGVDTKALLAALALKKLDPDVVLQQQRDLIRYVGIIAPYVPMTQAELFQGLDTAPLAERAAQDMTTWEAEERGYNAGIAGGGMDDCPFEPGTPAYVAFHEGFIRGQSVIAERMGPAGATQARTSRTKRRSGRDKAAGADTDDDPRQTDLEEAVAGRT